MKTILSCLFCGDYNVEPANGVGYETPENSIVFCNCCGRSGKPQIVYDEVGVFDWSKIEALRKPDE